MIKQSDEKKLSKLLAKCAVCDHKPATCGVPVYQCVGPIRRMTDAELKRRVVEGDV